MRCCWAGSLAKSGSGSRDGEHAALIEDLRVNERHLPGVVLPEAILVTSLAAVATEGVDLMVAAVPTSYLRTSLDALAPELPAETPVLSVAKGIEFGSFARPSQIIEQCGPAANRGALRAEPCRRARPGPASFGGGFREVGVVERAGATC